VNNASKQELKATIATQFQMMREYEATIERLQTRISELQRGEFICIQCGLRKDGQPQKPEF
jgi:rubrerythrin